MPGHVRQPILSIAVLPERSLFSRLAASVAFAAAELRKDPIAFGRALLAADVFDRRDKRLLWSVRLGVPAASAIGLALGVLLYAMIFGAPLAVVDGEPRRAGLVIKSIPPPVAPRGESHGGGGSGDHDPTPVSRGVPPPSSLADPVTVATTKDVIHPPNPLPVPPAIKAPAIPVLPDRYGDPTSGITTPSDGPGTGGGAGDGDGNGWGPDKGPGAGPGRDGGRDDGPFAPGRAPRPEPPAAVATRVVILNTPRPAYTEAARANKTEGIVRVRALFGADGRVKRATVTRGLPDGLDERALEALHRIAFRPARDAAGRAVDSWVTVSVSFTIR